MEDDTYVPPIPNVPSQEQIDEARKILEEAQAVAKAVSKVFIIFLFLHKINVALPIHPYSSYLIFRINIKGWVDH